MNTPDTESKTGGIRHALYLIRIAAVYPPGAPAELLAGQLDRIAAVASAAWHEIDLPSAQSK